MSAATDATAGDLPQRHDSASGWLSAVDRLVGWCGDRVNPILVKETRQALKSRQFTITFGLLLIAGWLVSIVGVVMIGPDIWYTARGRDMFFAYYLILAFPLLVIVPFGAFRSLASEQEDRTYELMWITSLGPRQIIRGKLGSTVLQMLIYLSALSPCLAFTYMLRGIDFPTILYILFYLVLASLALSVVSLLIGTLSSEKHWQVVLSVLLIVGLLLGLWVGSWLVAVMLWFGESAFGQREFWQANAAFLTGYVGYFVFLFYAAAAAVTFSSENRSTRLRITMLVQHVLLTGWMAWLWISPAEGDGFALIMYMIFIGLHWWIMGALMTGESPELSPRVKRRLPQSFLGRVFLTWFNPGPGAGYMLAVGSLSGVLVTVGIAVAVAEVFRSSMLSDFRADHSLTILAFGLAGLSYVVIYLGLGLLIIRLVRRLAHGGILLSLLLQILLVLVGIMIPGLPALWRGSGYNLWQISNPVWTLIELGEDRRLPPDGPLLMIVLSAVALVVFLLNLPGISREVRQVRIARPKRVAEEDAALAAIKRPPQVVKTSPWD